jgi:hypothetical protein
MTMTGQEYIPGVCNIGRSETKQRRALGWIGLAATIALWATCALLNVRQTWRIGLFLPAMLSALGFLQSAWHFCVIYGLNSEFKFGRTTGKSDSPAQADFRRKDRRTALRIFGISVLIGAATALVAYFTPL